MNNSDSDDSPDIQRKLPNRQIAKPSILIEKVSPSVADPDSIKGIPSITQII